jgi:hypothetical protein
VACFALSAFCSAASALGAIIALLSSFFVTAALVEIVVGGDGETEVPVLAGLFVFFGATALAGSIYPGAWSGGPAVR